MPFGFIIRDMHQFEATFLLFLLLQFDCQRPVSALKCYKCSMTHDPSSGVNGTSRSRLCANFDYSDRYIVDCPYSTLCMKKDFSVNLTQPINGTQRDCANQRYDYQDYQDGKWQLKVSIEEPYDEGCAFIDDKGARSARIEFCYCRQDLCNGGGRGLHAKGATEAWLVGGFTSVLLLLFNCLVIK